MENSELKDAKAEDPKIDDPIFYYALQRYYTYSVAQTTSYSLVECKGEKYLVVFKLGRIFDVKPYNGDGEMVALDNFDSNTRSLTADNYKKLAKAVRVAEAKSFFEEDNQILLMKNMNGCLKWFYLRFQLIDDGRCVLCISNGKANFQLKLGSDSRSLETARFYLMNKEDQEKCKHYQELIFKFRESDDVAQLVKDLMRGAVSKQKKIEARALRHARRHLEQQKKLEEKRALRVLERGEDADTSDEEDDEDDQESSEDDDDDDEIDEIKLDAIRKLAEKVDVKSARDFFLICASSYRID
jgi:hypothetical protein